MTDALSDPEAAWNEWRARRDARLRAPDGWLALVGLHWLQEGENRVEGLPGVFAVRGQEATLRATAEDGWRLGGAPVTERVLRTDAKGKADRLELGTRIATIVQRGPALALRVWDAASPALRAFRGVEVFPFDPRWRVYARWEPYASPRLEEQPSTAGPPQRAVVPGRARFALEGHELSLEPTLEAGGALQFVFRDATAPQETYGGGRFLAARPPASGRLVLDFNRAYNPPCAFTEFATCPLASPGNVLSIRIEAGEKAPGAG
jgi:uncharacterized protein (DUF1684 family)